MENGLPARLSGRFGAPIRKPGLLNFTENSVFYDTGK